MDRTLLEELLAQGLSLEAIGQHVGRHESTVAYWVAKHGLQAAHREKHLARGGISREELSPLVQAGMSTMQIADTLGFSKTTVRHWLREYGLTTRWAERRRAANDGQRQLELRCTRHGMTTFQLRNGGGYRCLKCRAEAVAKRRRKVKRMLVDEAGGSCRLCGYDRCISALEFHHLVPAEKRFALSARG